MKFVIPEKVKLILSELTARGYEAFVVGGCVRDVLLNEEPKDWDICTNALPEQIKACFSSYRTFDAGIKHGTVSVVSGSEVYEVTTYRVDGAYSDSRHPESVTFTRSLSDDLARRDFTVNSMAYNGEAGLVDPFGGVDDLKAGILRCVGNPALRFSEDALRIMRALRFSSVLGMKLEDNTAAALIQQAELLNNISAERISVELVKLLCGKNAESVLNDYREIMALIIPELKATFDYEQRTVHHCFDVWRHITKSVSLVESDPLLRVTMLFHDIGKPLACTTDIDGTTHFKGHQLISAEIAERALRRLRFPNAFISDCIGLIRAHDIRHTGGRKQMKRILASLGAENTKKLFAVQRADTFAQSEYMRREKLESIDRAEQICNELLAENACVSLKDLAVNGNDLKAVGITDGKKIGAVLKTLLDMVIEETVPNVKETLLAEAKNIQ